MNIKEIFDKAENGTLTFEQFEELAKADGAKFADLSEGKYVSKSKYDDDIKSKDTSIEQLNSTIEQRDADLSSLQAKLKDAGTDATKLSELQTNFDSLQTKYTTDMQNYQQQLAEQQYEFAVKEFANNKKFTSNAAKRDFTTAMIGAKLKFDANKGKILGADDFVASYSEDNADAFLVETATPEPDAQQAQPKPHFSAPTSGSTQVSQPKSTFGFDFATVRKKE